MVNPNKQPERKPEMVINIGNQRLVCTPENTLAYLYEDQRFDHLFYVTEDNGKGELSGYHLWRTMLDDMFDDAIHHMIATGYTVESLLEPDDCDRQAFFNKFKDEPLEPIELIQPQELTPRQEAFVARHGEFLQTIIVTAEDFI